MAPKVNVRVTAALRALAEQDAPGPLDKRGEFATDAVMDAAIEAYADELGGRGARSRAIRTLIAKGAAQVVAERSVRA